MNIPPIQVDLFAPLITRAIVNAYDTDQEEAAGREIAKLFADEGKCYVLWSRPHRRMAYACCCDLGSVKKHIGQFDPARHFTGLEPTHRDWVQPFFDWLNDHPLPLEQQDF